MENVSLGFTGADSILAQASVGGLQNLLCLGFILPKESPKPEKKESRVHARNVERSKQAVVRYQYQDRKFSREVPEHLKGHSIPESINDFLTGLKPNLSTFIEAHIRKTGSDADEVLSNFVVYFLSNCGDGYPRYLRYDPVKYPDQPYYRYTISLLRYFCLNYQTEQAKLSRLMGISDGEEEIQPGQISADTLFYEVDVSDTEMQEELYLKEIGEFLSHYSQQFHPKLSFETYAPQVYAMKLAGYENKEIGENIGVSSSTIVQWVVRLQNLLKAFLAKEWDFKMKKAWALSHGLPV